MTPKGDSAHAGAGNPVHNVGNSLQRGRLVAGILAGSWRTPPPLPSLTSGELTPIVPILTRQASAGLAWARIRDSELATAPGAQELHDAFRHYTLRARFMEHHLPLALDHFRARGIEVVLAKGWSLGRLYPEPGRRPYGDLDFMVREEQVEEANRALRAPDAPKVAIELHPQFNELRDRDPEDLFRRAEPVELEGVAIPVMPLEDHLRLVALHGLEHGYARPLWLCDLGVLLENLPEGFDWERCTEGEAWLNDGIRCALGLTRELLSVDLEAAGVPRPWLDPPPPSWAVDAALAAFGARAHYMDMADLGEAARSPNTLLRAARLRWANPIEATFRREAPWDDSPRLGVQLSDYLRRAGGFISRR